MTLWAALYLITHLLLALGLGGLLLRAPRAVPLPPLARFFAGMALTPLVSGLWAMLCALLATSLPRVLMVGGLVLMAVVLCLFTLRRAPRRLWRAWRRQAWLPGGIFVLSLIYAGVALAMALLVTQLARNAAQPFASHDVLNYLSEALYFLTHGGAMLGMSDAVDGSVRGSTHGFIFSAMFAAALSFCDGVAGHAHDHAARIAAQLTIPAMLCAEVALAATLKRRGAGALAVLLLITVPQFEYVSFAASRDAFRIVPLVLLVLLLGSLPRVRVRGATLLLLAALAAVAFSAHTLNILVIATCAAMWMLLSIRAGGGWRRALLVAVALATGVALASGRYVDSYLGSGQLWGELPARYALAGTVLADAWQHIERYANSHALGGGQKLMVLLERDHGLLSGAGLLAAALLLMRRSSRREFTAARLAAATAIALVVPIVGVFDFEPYRLSDWLVENLRYVLHWYPLLAISVVAALVWSGEFARSGARAAAHGVTVLIVLASATLAAHSLWHWRGDASRLASRRELTSSLALLSRAEGTLASGQRLCIDDFGYNYYLDNRALLLGSKASWPLLRAIDSAAANAQFEALGIGAVMLKKRSIPQWWDRLPFHAALTAGTGWRPSGETRAMIAYERDAVASSAP